MHRLCVNNWHSKSHNYIERIELSTPCYKTNTLPLSYRGSNLNWQGALIYQHYGKTNLPKCARYIMFYHSDVFFSKAPYQLLIKKFSWRKGRKITGDAEDWTWGLIHAKHALYHWATSPTLCWLLLCVIFFPPNSLAFTLRRKFVY